MTLSRRQALGAIGVGAIALQGCTQRPKSTTHTSQEVLLMNRFGFGANPLQPAFTSNPDQWFDEQLSAPADDPVWLQSKLWALPMTHLSPWELRDWPELDVLKQLQQAAILRATYSPWQVRERIVHFWSDHFNVFARKGLGAYRKPLDEKLVVRANALGTFPNMLKASAQSAAMLVYLDQQASSSAHPNENYARELLELHTLGVDQGYSQRDVMEVARCFTGWTEERGFLRPKGAFKFDEDLHDKGEKRVLGQNIPAGGGVEDGFRVLEILSSHKATAAHVSRKLCRSFFGDDGAKVAPEVEKVYATTGGDIKEVLRVVFRSNHTKSEPKVIKRPFDYLVSSLRFLGAETDGGPALQDHLSAMGQPLYQWPMPDGYPVDTSAWSGSLLARWNFAISLTQGQINGTTVNLTDEAQATMLQLASPEFQWR